QPTRLQRCDASRLLDGKLAARTGLSRMPFSRMAARGAWSRPMRTGARVSLAGSQPPEGPAAAAPRVPGPVVLESPGWFTTGGDTHRGSSRSRRWSLAALESLLEVVQRVRPELFPVRVRARAQLEHAPRQEAALGLVVGRRERTPEGDPRLRVAQPADGRLRL